MEFRCAELLPDAHSSWVCEHRVKPEAKNSKHVSDMGRTDPFFGIITPVRMPGSSLDAILSEQPESTIDPGALTWDTGIVTIRPIAHSTSPFIETKTMFQ